MCCAATDALIPKTVEQRSMDHFQSTGYNRVRIVRHAVVSSSPLSCNRNPQGSWPLTPSMHCRVLSWTVVPVLYNLARGSIAECTAGAPSVLPSACRSITTPCYFLVESCGKRVEKYAKAGLSTIETYTGNIYVLFGELMSREVPRYRRSTDARQSTCTAHETTLCTRDEALHAHTRALCDYCSPGAPANRATQQIIPAKDTIFHEKVVRNLQQAK